MGSVSEKAASLQKATVLGELDEFELLALHRLPRESVPLVAWRSWVSGYGEVQEEVDELLRRAGVCGVLVDAHGEQVEQLVAMHHSQSLGVRLGGAVLASMAEEVQEGRSGSGEVGGVQPHGLVQARQDHAVSEHVGQVVDVFARQVVGPEVEFSDFLHDLWEVFGPGSVVEPEAYRGHDVQVGIDGLELFRTLDCGCPKAALVDVEPSQPGHVQGQSAGYGVDGVHVEEGHDHLPLVVLAALDDGPPGDERAQAFVAEFRLVRHQVSCGLVPQAGQQLGGLLGRAGLADRVSAAQLGAQPQGQAASCGAGLGKASRQRRASHGHGAVEEPPAAARHQVAVRADGAGRVAHQGHLVGVAAEGRDVVPHPAQGQLLVLESPVAAGGRVPGAEEAERAHAVVERHEHQLPVEQVLGAVRAAAALVEGAERAAVQPHQHGESGAVLGTVRGLGSEHVEVETVLGARHPLRRGGVLVLHAHRHVLQGR